VKVSELTVEEFRTLLRDTLSEPLPNDEGELRPEFVLALRSSVAASRPGIGSDELRRRLGQKVNGDPGWLGTAVADLENLDQIVVQRVIDRVEWTAENLGVVRHRSDVYG
jgi:hypothetical protein